MIGTVLNNCYPHSGLLKDSFPECAFRLHVQRTGEIIKNQQFRLADKHPRRRPAPVQGM